MRKIVTYVALATVMSFVGCGESSDSAGDGKPVVFASIQPVAFLVDRIAGDAVTVRTLVKPGQDPHTYEPSPRDMVELSRARLFLRAGTPFEEVIVPRLAHTGTKLRIVDVTEGIKRHPADERQDEHATGAAEDDHDVDPHVWTSPVLMKRMAARTAEALCELVPESKAEFAQNLATLTADLDKLHDRLTRAFAPMKGRTFFVFHAAFGYLAEEYGLNQESVEAGGKSPSAKHIRVLVEKARAQNVKVIFVQPQFSTQAAASIARQIDGAVVPLDPLSRDYLANMERIADEIAKALKTSNR